MPVAKTNVKVSSERTPINFFFFFFKKKKKKKKKKNLASATRPNNGQK